MSETARDIIQIDHERNMPAAAKSTSMTPMEMIGRALEMGLPADVLKQMMDLRDREEANRSRKAFDAAMADAKADIPEIGKNRLVDFTSQKGRTHYRHEDLAGIARIVNPILSKHGLSYRYRTETKDGVVAVTCIVSHRDGYSEENTLTAAHDASGNKNSIQAIGSTITYLQRYTLKAALGLAASNDDDGASSGKTPEQTRTISDDQIKELRALISETGTDIEKFCEVGHIEDLPHMLASDFADAKHLLEAKKRKMAS